MSRPSSYDLLIEVTKSQNRLEDKIDKRFEAIELRTQTVETKLDQMIGKVGIGVLVITMSVSAFLSFAVEFIKKQIWR